MKLKLLYFSRWGGGVRKGLVLLSQPANFRTVKCDATHKDCGQLHQQFSKTQSNT